MTHQWRETGRSGTYSRAYYRNSLNAWRDKLLRERRRLMARYAVMERQRHPDKNDQGILMDINRQMIGIVESAIRVCDALSGEMQS
jgi:hypothetical protein